MTIKEQHIDLGAEFVEVDCFTCRHRDGMPKLVYMQHNGYGTKQLPPKEHLQRGNDEAKKHDVGGCHDVTIFIGHG